MGKQAVGRNWATADKAALTEFDIGDSLVRLDWSDGAFIVQSFETHQEGRECLRRCGFAA